MAKQARRMPGLTPRGTISIKFTEEPNDDDWFALMRFFRANTVWDNKRKESGGYDVTIIPREHREEVQRDADLEKEPVFVTVSGGIIGMFWDADGHVMDNDTASMPDEDDEE